MHDREAELIAELCGPLPWATHRPQPHTVAAVDRQLTAPDKITDHEIPAHQMCDRAQSSEGRISGDRGRIVRPSEPGDHLDLENGMLDSSSLRRLSSVTHFRYFGAVDAIRWRSRPRERRPAL